MGDPAEAALALDRGATAAREVERVQTENRDLSTRPAAALARAGTNRQDAEARLASAVLAREAGEGEAARLRDEGADLSRKLAEAILRQEEAEGRAEAAQASDADLRARLASALEEIAAPEADRQAALLAAAQAQLAEAEAVSADGQREGAALNAQVAELRGQVASLQMLVDLAETADAAADVQIEALGADLNTALARVAQEPARPRRTRGRGPRAGGGHRFRPDRVAETLNWAVINVPAELWRTLESLLISTDDPEANRGYKLT